MWMATFKTDKRTGKSKSKTNSNGHGPDLQATLFHEFILDNSSDNATMTPLTTEIADELQNIVSLAEPDQANDENPHPMNTHNEMCGNHSIYFTISYLRTFY